MITLGWPQVIYILLGLIGIARAFAHHGKPKTGTESAPATVVAWLLVLALLYWGGFFG
jgi:hypothetical protein